ncbi:hypothetical protein Q3A80_02790 [Burkholderia sp. SR8]|jgi:hypothetical protein|uniref:hypothetical protein n=1 Tax=Burkholderia sp. SR8 TaxID=3062277 RepID=UPI004063F246
MKYGIEIDSREKKSAKKRVSFIRLKTFECRSRQSRNESFAGCAARRAGRSGIFYALVPRKPVDIAALPSLNPAVPVRYFMPKHPQIFPNFL